MDLALELGHPAEVLARTMTEREFRRWQVYAGKRLLPTQRVELYLAQIAQMIAITMGGAKNVRITDYLLEMQQPAATLPDDEDVVEAARKAFGYNPRKGN